VRARRPRGRLYVVRNVALISALLAFAIPFAGCGGSDGDKTLSSEEYAAAVTQICTSSAGKLRSLLAASGTSFLVSKGDEFAAYASRNITKLKSLRPPPELESKAHQIVADAEATRDRLIVVVRAAKKHPGSVDLGDTKLLTARHRMIETANSIGATC
jgi:hypothetical protein